MKEKLSSSLAVKEGDGNLENEEERSQSPATQRNENNSKALKDTAFRKMVDQQSGHIVNQVSTSMIDLDDILYNKQFQNGKPPTSKLAKMYQNLRKEAI